MPCSMSDAARQVFPNPAFEPATEAIARERQATGPLYPGSDVERVPAAQAAWEKPADDYRPPSHTSPGVVRDPSADPGLVSLMRPGTVLFNQLDRNFNPPVDRRSHLGQYQIVGGVPLCPLGRRGVAGRGNLRRWGPNHEAVAVISRVAGDAVEVCAAGAAFWVAQVRALQVEGSLLGALTLRLHCVEHPSAGLGHQTW